MSWRTINWRRELLLVCILGLDATWLTPWTAILTGTAHDPARGLSLAMVLALLLAGLAITRLLVASRLPLAGQQALAGAVAVAAGLAVVRLRLYGGQPLAAWLRDLARLQGAGVSGLIFLGLALYACGRSISLLQSRLETAAVGFYWRFAIVAWLWYGLYGLFAGPDPSPAGLVLLTFLGLLAVGLSRVEEVHNGPGAVRTPFSGSWLLIMAGASLGTVGLGVMVTLLLSPRAVQAAWRALWPVWAALGWLFRRLVEAVFLLATPLIEALARALGPAGERLVVVPTPALGPTPVPAEPQPAGLPAPVQLLLWVAAGLAFLIVVALVVMGLRRREGEGESPGARDAAWEDAAGGGGEGLGAGLRRLQRRLVGALAAAGAPAYPLATVREIYASVQRLAGRGGVRREEAETPYEYRRRLGGAWPEGREAADAITEAYVRAHYGQRSFDEGELAQLRAAWRRLKELIEGQSSTGAG